MPGILIWTCAAFVIGYAVVILWYTKMWADLPKWQIPAEDVPSLFVSVIVIGRNEENLVRTCIQSLLDQDYPSDLCEILFIDDHSTDRTAEVVRQIDPQRVRVVLLEDYPEILSGPAFKKAALELGVELASGDFILTTDADCRADPNWIRAMTSIHLSKQQDFITGPVLFEQVDTPFKTFQALEFLGIIGATAVGIHTGTHYSANAANLGFTKSLFKKAFKRNAHDHFASGDDMFFIQNVKQASSKQVAFLKCPGSVVYTTPVQSISGFVQQRIRWGAKNIRYRDKSIFLIWIYVWLMHCFLVIALLTAIFTGEWGSLLLVLGLIGIKLLVEYRYLHVLATFFKVSVWLRGFPAASLLNMCYVLSIGLILSVKRTYVWRGRKVK